MTLGKGTFCVVKKTWSIFLAIWWKYAMGFFPRSLIQELNPLNANPEKWSNTFKQIVGNLPTICLSVFDHFMNLALKGLRNT